MTVNRYYFERCKLTVEPFYSDTNELVLQTLDFWGLFDRRLGRDAPIAYIAESNKAQKIVDALNRS